MIAYDQQSRLKSAIAGLFNSSSGSWLDRELFLSLILRNQEGKDKAYKIEAYRRKIFGITLVTDYGWLYFIH